MEKKKYIYPKTDVSALCTSKVMAFTDASEYDPAHVGSNYAPERKTDVF